ncbi:MAG TPA: hypothetical protein VKT20_10815 [Candidatus Dormibacteraeota bacterium]|nr:hypothetical protein [Candidatus Dormibacteraeota bacterium]
MRALFAMLADFALGHADGKVYILGGGLEIVRAPALPFVIPNISFVVKVEFTPAEAGRPRVIEVMPLDSDASPLGPPTRVEVTPQQRSEFQGLPVSVQVVLNIRDLKIERAQTLAFAVLVDGHEVASVPLHILPPRQV